MKDDQNGATRQEAKRRFMDMLREDAEERGRWKKVIGCGDSFKKLSKAKGGRRS